MSTRTASSNPSAALVFRKSRIARWIAKSLRAADSLAPDFVTRFATILFFTPFPLKLRARRWPGFPWHTEFLSTGTTRVAVLRHTRAKALKRGRPKVLLVHGWAGDAIQMLPLGDAIYDAGFEPVLLDLPAHGSSDGWHCTMPQIVSSLFALQREVGPLWGIVAHSMSAVASLHAVARGLCAERVVVMAPSATPASMLKWFGHVFDFSKNLIARMRSRIEAQQGMVFDQFESEWIATRLKANVLIIHDRGDRISPIKNGQALAKMLPKAQLHVTEGLSHRRMLSDAHVIYTALRHLRVGAGIEYVNATGTRISSSFWLRLRRR